MSKKLTTPTVIIPHSVACQLHSEALAEQLSARDLHPAELDLCRDGQQGRHQDTCGVREADRANLEFPLLLRALWVRARGIVLLLVDAVEDVYTAYETASAQSNKEDGKDELREMCGD